MTAGRARIRGTTLVETLVLLAILGALAGMATLALRQPPGLVLDRTTRGILADLRQARTAAMTRGEVIRVRFDTEARTLVVPALALTRTLPQRIDARVTGAAAAQAGGTGSEGAVDILFYPDASTSGADIDLAVGDRQRRISVHWLSGQVRQDAP